MADDARGDPTIVISTYHYNYNYSLNTYFDTQSYLFLPHIKKKHFMEQMEYIIESYSWSKCRGQLLGGQVPQLHLQHNFNTLGSLNFRKEEVKMVRSKRSRI